MKKLLILGLVLALVAIVAVPVAASAAGGNTGTVTVNAGVVGPTISIAVPNTLPLGTFAAGWNVNDWTNNGQNSSNQGTLSMVPGTDGITSWTVNAHGGANMNNGSISLADPLLIGPTNGAWSCADGTSPGAVHGSNYSGVYTVTGSTASGTFDLWAAQYLESQDAQNVANSKTSGTFNDTITFTATCSP